MTLELTTRQEGSLTSTPISGYRSSVTRECKTAGATNFGLCPVCGTGRILLRMGGYRSRILGDRRIRMTYKYDHIHLTTQDIEGWVQWYVDSMAATVTDSNVSPSGGTVNLDVGGAPIRISNLTGVERGLREQTGEDVLPHEGYHHFVFLVDNIDARVAELVSRGAEVESAVRQASPTVRSGFLNLPGGVRIELCERLE